MSTGTAAITAFRFRLGAFITLLGFAVGSRVFAGGPGTLWTAINVNETDLQADAHLLEFPDGYRLLIDAGNDTPTLVSALKKRGIDVLHRVLISHPHKDHYAGLIRLINSTIKVGEVFMNAPDRAICDREIPWGCDYPHVLKTIALLRERGTPVRNVIAGTVLYDRPGHRLEVLYAYDGVHTPVGPTDINDMSAIALLTVGKTRALFTGDLNAAIGNYLCTHGERELSADVLKVPHHGTDSLAPNCFFDRVGARKVVVPSPATLWKSARSQRPRSYFGDKKIPAYVNGLQGEIRVLFSPDSYEISSEMPLAP